MTHMTPKLAILAAVAGIGLAAPAVYAETGAPHAIKVAEDTPAGKVMDSDPATDPDDAADDMATPGSNEQMEMEQKANETPEGKVMDSDPAD